MTAPDLAALEAAHRKVVSLFDAAHKAGRALDSAELFHVQTARLLIFEAFPGVLAHIKEQAARIADYENSITWGTTCLNCASLLDNNYEQYCELETQAAEIERLAKRDADRDHEYDKLEAENRTQAARIAELEGQVARVKAVLVEYQTSRISAWAIRRALKGEGE